MGKFSRSFYNNSTYFVPESFNHVSVKDVFIIDNSNIRRFVHEYLQGNPKKYPRIGTWDVHRVTNMARLFYGHETFNEMLDWNTSNVIDMNHMFSGCKSFNQPLTFRGQPWNTSKVTNMRGMFIGCIQFNQPITFNTTNVLNMAYMFSGCVRFNQPVLLDTHNVEDFRYMFVNCSAFNHPIHFNAINADKTENMFHGCTSLLYRPVLDYTNFEPDIDFQRSLKKIYHGIPQLPYSMTRSVASFLGGKKRTRRRKKL